MVGENPAEVTAEPKAEYDLHIKMPGEMHSVLGDTAHVAYRDGGYSQIGPSCSLEPVYRLRLGYQKKRWLGPHGRAVKPA